MKQNIIRDWMTKGAFAGLLIFVVDQTNWRDLAIDWSNVKSFDQVALIILEIGGMIIGGGILGGVAAWVRKSKTKEQ